jgi:hypothetical protein
MPIICILHYSTPSRYYTCVYQSPDFTPILGPWAYFSEPSVRS